MFKLRKGMALTLVIAMSFGTLPINSFGLGTDSEEKALLEAEISKATSLNLSVFGLSSSAPEAMDAFADLSEVALQSDKDTLQAEIDSATNVDTNVSSLASDYETARLALAAAETTFQSQKTQGIKTASMSTLMTTASADLSNTKVSTDGADVEKSEVWVTQSKVDALASAISTVQSALTAPSNDPARASAYLALNNTMESFDNSKANGTLVTKQDLQDLVDSYSTSLNAVVPSLDGKDVPANKKWATTTQIQGMVSALSTAQDIANGVNTSVTVGQGYTDLMGNWTSFQSILQDGTFIAGDRTALQAKVAEMNTLLESIFISADGSDVPKNKQWTTSSTKDALIADTATEVATASNVMATQQVADDALASLTTKLNNFVATLQAGTYTDPAFVATYPKIDASSTYNSLVVDIKSDKDTVAKVWYTATNTDPATVSADMVRANGRSVSVTANTEATVTIPKMLHDMDVIVYVTLGNSSTVEHFTTKVPALPVGTLAVGSESYTKNDLIINYVSDNYKGGKVYIYDEPAFGEFNTPDSAFMSGKDTALIDQDGKFQVSFKHLSQPSGDPYITYFMFEDKDGNKSPVYMGNIYQYNKQYDDFTKTPELIPNESGNSLVFKISSSTNATLKTAVVNIKDFNSQADLDAITFDDANDKQVLKGNNEVTFGGLTAGETYVVLIQLGNDTRTRFTIPAYQVALPPHLSPNFEIHRPAGMSTDQPYSLTFNLVDLDQQQPANEHTFTVPAGEETITAGLPFIYPVVGDKYVLTVSDGTKTYYVNELVPGGVSVSIPTLTYPQVGATDVTIKIPAEHLVNMKLKLSNFFSNPQQNYIVTVWDYDTKTLMDKVVVDDINKALTAEGTVSVPLHILETSDKYYVNIQVNNAPDNAAAYGFVTPQLTCEYPGFITEIPELTDFDFLDGATVTFAHKGFATLPAFSTDYPKVTVDGQEVTVTLKGSKAEKVALYYLPTSVQAPTDASAMVSALTDENKLTLTSTAEQTFTFHNTAIGDYKLYAVAYDVDGQYSAISAVPFKVIHVDSPAVAFSTGFPSVTSISATSQTLSFKTVSDSTVYYMTKLSSATAPTAAELIASGTTVTTQANTTATKALALSAGTYTVYAVSKATGALTTTVATSSFTVPTTTTNTGNSGGGGGGGGSSSSSGGGGGGGGSSSDATRVSSTGGDIVTSPKTGTVAEVSPIATNGVVKATITQDLSTKSPTTTTVKVTTPTAAYNLPVELTTTKAVTSVLGLDPAKVSNVTVDVSISAPSVQTTATITNANPNLVGKPVEFKVTANVTGTDNKTTSTEIHSFSNYVSREIVVPTGVDASTLTGGTFSNNGEFTALPSTVVTVGSKTVIRIFSTTNSVYGLVQNKEVVSSAKGSWSEKAVNSLLTKQVISSSFDINKATTRAEFAEMIVKALGIKADTSKVVRYSDVASNEYVYIATALGIVSGKGDGVFAPNATITRAEMGMMILNANKYLGLTKTTELKTPTDIIALPNWASPVLKLMEYGIFKGYSDGSLKPNANITNAESAQVLYNALSAGFATK